MGSSRVGDSGQDQTRSDLMEGLTAAGLGRIWIVWRHSFGEEESWTFRKRHRNPCQ